MKKLALLLSLLLLEICSSQAVISQGIVFHGSPRPVALVAVGSDGNFHFLGLDGNGNLITGGAVGALQATVQTSPAPVALVAIGSDDL